jgi:hypothetical protein
MASSTKPPIGRPGVPPEPFKSNTVRQSEVQVTRPGPSTPVSLPAAVGGISELPLALVAAVVFVGTIVAGLALIKKGDF